MSGDFELHYRDAFNDSFANKDVYVGIDFLKDLFCEKETIAQQVSKEVSTLETDVQPCSEKSPLAIIASDQEGKELVNIGGRLVEWSTIFDFLKLLKLVLVPNDTIANYTPRAKGHGFVRRKWGVRELGNLKFDVNY